MKPASELLFYLDWVRGVASLSLLTVPPHHSFPLHTFRRHCSPRLMSRRAWCGAPEIGLRYIIHDRTCFGFFPWAAFVAVGMSAGSILRPLSPEEIPSAMQWLGWGGLALSFGADSISSMSISI